MLRRHHCVFFIYLMIINTSALERYEPNWDSLDKRPLPSWYDEAKIGIFIHWGVYSVPSFGSEWFWTDWINLRYPNYLSFMKNNYKPNFSYQEFAHEFTAELFNATKWALLFRDSGAKYQKENNDKVLY
ncbi:putative alpha-L-fucosidase [Rhagoletis pomonella]|uniref:putative alpha-L-fucosidase n=1 Tax=Rhagoletis pomonella TaxID=28610 RepID=UPI00177B44F3|nr:putative alpha-L-fucosidase [Rhagoletis pomonella]